MYILDTNIVIYLFKNMGNVAETLLPKAPKDIAISTITLHELEVGAAKEGSVKKRKQLDVFVSNITVLPIDSEIAKVSAEIRAKLENKGLPIGPLDTLIAGTALSTHAILVTHNTKEFQRVDGLEIEDWY